MHVFINFFKKVVINGKVGRDCLGGTSCPGTKGLYCCTGDGCNTSAKIVLNKALILSCIMVFFIVLF